MSEQQKRELVDAAQRAIAAWRELSPEDRASELKRIGIVDADGQLAERYGGPSRRPDAEAEVTAR